MNQVYIYFCAGIKYNYVLKMVAFNIKKRNPLIAATHSFAVKVKSYHKMLETNTCVYFCDDNIILYIFL